MSSFWNSNSFNYSGSLFSSYGSSSSNSGTGMTSLLGEYASIKSGSYKKLLVEYYKKNPVEKEGSKQSSSAVNDSSKELTNVKDDASALQDSAAALRTRGTKSVFEKKTIKTTDEKTGEVTEKQDYDRDAIGKAIDAFVKDYNSLIDSAGDLDTNSVLKKAVYLTSATKANEKLLKEVGITIGKDNHLSVDADKLKEADISKLKTLFNGTNSYADKVYEKARQIDVEASVAAVKSAKTYNNNGGYNVSTGSLYNSLY